jgi:hypothetical protein
MSHRSTALKSILLAAAIGIAGVASAQSTDGNIAGTATAGQTIIVRGDNGVEREIKIEEDGKFSIRHLPVGTYQVIRLDAEGNALESRTAAVSVGKTTRIM